MMPSKVRTIKFFVTSEPDEMYIRSAFGPNPLSAEFVNLKYTTKDSSSLKFVDFILLAMYSLRLSDRFYSHYHNCFERKQYQQGKRFAFRILKSFKGRYPSLFDRLYSRVEYFVLFFRRDLDSLFRLSRKTTPHASELHIYNACLSSSLEIKYLRKSIQGNHSVAILVRNWDNPSSKLFLPSSGVSFIASWSTQMDEQIRMINSSAQLLRYTTPRFESYSCPEYINDHCRPMASEISPPLQVLFAGSQKSIDHEIDLLQELDLLISNCSTNLFIIYRTHPWNLRPTADKINILKRLKNVSLDSTILDCSPKRQNPPIFDPSVRSSLSRHICSSSVVISSAGTISLEAALFGKPVIVDFTNNRQVTLKLSMYMDHMCEYLSEGWVFPCFSPRHIIRAIKTIGDTRFDPSEIQAGAKRYADIAAQLPLSELVSHLCSGPAASQN